MILGQDFFSPSALRVAPDLLGKFLVSRKGTFLISETEAYDGPQDKASHASKGRTRRTEIMFGPSGHWYVYLIYGSYHMLNIVSDKDSYPSAVLIRGLSGYDGPGKLTKALGIDMSFNGKKASQASGLWIEDRGITIKKSNIIKTPRIGVDYAGPVWSQKHYRFLLKDEKRILEQCN
ncbi:MAG: DNA-3-methyladenine glycosylase [Candidatus Harrisonbacteria bacterium]|nr:DNA-3-methyladenine glycosylase [Candidatus Harrisonbacteria bacterium]